MLSLSIRLCPLPAIALIVLLSGCAQIPKEEFGKYSDTFEQVRGVTEILIDDFENAQKVVKRTRGTASATRFAPTFDPQQLLSAARRPPDIAARIAALDAVSNYNQALLALAEGRGVDSAKALTGGLFGLAASFAPQVKLVDGLVTSVIAAVERARTQAEFVRAYRLAVSDASCGPAAVQAAADSARPTSETAGTSAAAPSTTGIAQRCGPIIPAIFAYLMEDTRNYYDARVALSNYRRAQATQSVRILEMQIERLTGSHALPADPAVSTQYQALAAEYRQLTAQLGDPTQPRNFGVGNQPYENTTHTELKALLASLRVVGEQEQKIVNDLNAYYARLTEYLRLLDRTQSYLNEVGAALEQPVNLNALTGQIINAGAALRRDGSDLQGAFLKLLGND
ncbi:MAG: hypothetical protein IH606_00770 [Burkholderiales bacterium]|nr:hypothetical protein [Burkholderiales bacterium]